MPAGRQTSTAPTIVATSAPTGAGSTTGPIARASPTAIPQRVNNSGRAGQAPTSASSFADSSKSEAAPAALVESAAPAVPVVSAVPVERVALVASAVPVVQVVLEASAVPVV